MLSQWAKVRRSGTLTEEGGSHIIVYEIVSDCRFGMGAGNGGEELALSAVSDHVISVSLWVSPGAALVAGS